MPISDEELDRLEALAKSAAACEYDPKADLRRVEETIDKLRLANECGTILHLIEEMRHLRAAVANFQRIMRMSDPLSSLNQFDLNTAFAALAAAGVDFDQAKRAVDDFTDGLTGAKAGN